MLFSIPILVEEHCEADAKLTSFLVRPLLHAGPVERADKLSRALNRLTGQLTELLTKLGREARHDALADWTFHPIFEEVTLDLRLELNSGSQKCQLFFAGYPALERKLYFTPAAPDLHFEVLPNQSLAERATAVLTQHFRAQEKERAFDLETLTARGKARLTTLEIELDPARLVKGPKKPKRAMLFGSLEKKDGETELRKTGRGLKFSYPDDLDRAVDREREVAELARLLAGNDRRPIVLVGPRQVGKTAIIHELVWRICAGKTERYAGGRDVWLVSPLRLISGMSYLGEWENRVLAIFAYAQASDKVLYFDDLLGLFTAGVSSASDLNVAQVLKPVLEKRNVRILAEITPESWRVLRERDRAFADFFHVIPIAETTEAETLHVLTSVSRLLEDSQGCEFSLEVVPMVFDLLRRFGGDASFPGKAAGFLKRIAVRSGGGKVDELVVLNDEAHHIHDASLAWFQSIADIHNRLLQKGAALSLQLDVSATPRHNNGAVFVQTVADYPLVEAIAQNVVKHPRLPDQASRDRLVRRQSAIYSEEYADYLNLGVIEWRKAHEEHRKLGKKAILFVMTDDTRNCDEVATYLSENYPDLKGAVLVIHTKQNGDISEAATGKAKEELDRLRSLANTIDHDDSPYKAIVSVLMLKEGWDVRNVTTIVGLRSYSAKSNILPEQTLGRGLRKMYAGGLEEGLSVIGTDAFMQFVESIQAEGVTLERSPMGPGGGGNTLLAIEVDRENTSKNLDALDIPLPILSARVVRQPNALAHLDPRSIPFQPLTYQIFGEDQLREIIFRDISTGEISHTTVLDAASVGDYRNVVGYFAQTLCQHTKLFSSQATLYGQLKRFIQHDLFGKTIDLEDSNTLRNLAEPPATRTIIDTFTKAINTVTVMDRGGAEIIGQLSLLATRPFMVKPQAYLVPTRSVFNRIVGDQGFELTFAEFLDYCPDVASFAKNYQALGFKLDYAKANGDLSNYYPDFIVKLSNGSVVIVETKGLVDVDVPHKIQRLAQWIVDLNRLQTDVIYDFAFVDEDGFLKYRPKSFEQLLQSFTQYKMGSHGASHF